MSSKETDPPMVALAEEIAEGVCLGQMAALAALRAEMTALSTMIAGVPHAPGSAATTEQPGARAGDPDPEDKDFDNMPV